MIIVNLILKSFPQKMYFIHDPNQDDAMCEPLTGRLVLPWVSKMISVYTYGYCLCIERVSFTLSCHVVMSGYICISCH